MMPEDVVEEHNKDGDGKIVLSEFNAVAADEDKPDCCTFSLMRSGIVSSKWRNF
jgi:hypothetical protein